MHFDSRGGLGYVASFLLVLSFLLSPFSALAQVRSANALAVGSASATSTSASGTSTPATSKKVVPDWVTAYEQGAMGGTFNSSVIHQASPEVLAGFQSVKTSPSQTQSSTNLASVSGASTPTPPPPITIDPIDYRYAVANPKEKTNVGQTGALLHTISLDIPPGRSGLQPDLKLQYSNQVTDDANTVGYGWDVPIPYISRSNKIGVDNLYPYSTSNATSTYFYSSLSGDLSTTTFSTSTSVLHDVVLSSYPDADPESTTFDGYTYGPGFYQGNVNFSTVRSNTTAGGSDSTVSAFDGINTDGWIRMNGQGFYDYIGRTYFLFNTSSLPADASITSATLLVFSTGYKTTPSVNLNVTTVTTATTTAVSNSDHALSNFGSTKLSDTSLSTADWTGGYKILPLNASGIAAVNKTGVTSLSLRTVNDIDNLNPNYTTGQSSAAAISFAEAGIAEAPKLVVTYTTTAAATSTTYYPRIDDGSFLSYQFTANQWTATDKSGRVYKFGTATTSRETDLNDPSKTYKWVLDEVRDPNGNYVKYQYVTDHGFVYPSKITYTGNGTTDGPMTIDFSRTSRSDAETTTAPGFSAQSQYLINQIQASVGGTWVRKYDLGYTVGDNKLRSLLSSVTESGQVVNNGTPSTASLSATTLSYQASTTGWATTTTSFSIPENFMTSDGHDLGVRILDINGDALPDLVKSQEGSTTNVYINSSSGWTLNNSWTVPEYFVSTSTSDYGVRFADVNGDGMVDILRAYSVGTTTVNKTYLNTGSGWTYNTSWTIPYNFIGDHGDTGARLADINGDGLVDDIVIQGFPESGNETKIAYLNTGSGLMYSKSWSDSLPSCHFVEIYNSGAQYPVGAKLSDVNHDGLTDCVLADHNLGWSGTYINNGNGSWSKSSTYQAPSYFSHMGGSDLGQRLTDVNGDGLPDMVVGDVASSTSRKAAYINNGSTWVYDAGWLLPVDFDTPDFAQLIDVNGDGIEDIIQGGQGSNSRYLNNSKVTDLLTNITSSAGAKTAIAYKSSAQYRDASNNALNPKLPLIVQTAQTIATNDGLGNIATTTYQFKDGTYYFASPLDRLFAGFGMASTTDAAGNKVAMYYHTGSGTATTSGEYNDNRAKIGQVYRTEQYDATNHLYQVNINKWDSSARATSSDFVKLAQTVTEAYDGDTTHRDTAQAFTYDNLTGNVIQKIMWGEVTGNNDGSFTDIGSDKRTTSIMYAASSTSSLSLPSDSTTTDQTGSRVSETRYYYDTLSLGSVIKGNLTKQESWKSGSTYINTQKAYNSYGLITQDTDPRGKITAYTYDAYNLYPATTTNPLSQTVAKTYDYASGKATQTVDPNGQVFQLILDPFSRILTEKIPDPTTGSLVTKASIVYTDTGMPKSIHKTSYLNAATSTDMYTYLDGFGRDIEDRSTAEGNNTYTVKDSQYDARGLLQSESLPFFFSGAAYSGTSTPAASALLTRYTYDPLQRVLTLANAVGTTTNSYHQWKVTTTDANGHAKDLIKDAYGNLATVVEYTSTSTGTTTYAYDGNNNLSLITDALSNIRNFFYDGLGRKIKAEDLHAPADTSFGSTTYIYDDAGNLTQQIDAKNQTVNRTFDDLNRLLTEDYLGQAGTETTNSYDWCSNGKGHLCSVVTADASTTDQYNPLGLLSSETKTVGTSIFTTSYLYDWLSNQTLITLPNNSQTKYTYNNAGLLEKLSTKQNGASAFSDTVSNFDYAPTGKVSAKTFANGVTSTYFYDANHLYRLTRILTTSPAH